MDSVMVEVGIGMAALYAVLSLFVTTLQELLINTLGRQRSIYLKKAVCSVLGEDAQRTQAFFKHPLIVSLSQGDGSRLPSYIPDELFAKAALSVMTGLTDPVKQLKTPEAVLAQMRAKFPPGGSFDPVAAIEAATQGSTNMPDFMAQMQAWIKQVGDRSTGWYKRAAQGFTLLIGLVVSIFLNIDAVRISQTLWSDGELRGQFVKFGEAVNAQANAASGAAPGLPAITGLVPATPKTQAPTLEAALADAERRLLALETLTGEQRYFGNDALMGFACEPSEDKLHCVAACASGSNSPECSKASNVALKDWPEDLRALRKQLGRIDPVALRRKEAAAGGASAKPGAACEVKATAGTATATEVDRRLALMAGVDSFAEAFCALQQQRGLLRRMQDEMQEALYFLSTKKSARDLLHELGNAVKGLDQTLDEAQQRLTQDSSDLQRQCARLYPGDEPLQARCVAKQRNSQGFELPLGWGPQVLSAQIGLGPTAKLLGTCGSEGGSCSFSWGLRAFWEVLPNALVGWVMSAFALSLGAPFWFDMLNRLIKMRTSLNPSEVEKKESGSPAASATPRNSGPAAAPAASPDAPPGGGGASATFANAYEKLLSVDQIKGMQAKLPVPQTGYFDADTRAALAARRAKLQLGSGSELDSDLMSEIMGRRSAELPTLPILALGDERAEVLTLRKRLAEILGNPSHARIDNGSSTFDKPLHRAVQLLQARMKVAIDGVVGPETWSKLDIAPGPALPADTWMKLAIGELGVQEVTNASRVLEYIRAVPGVTEDSVETKWCGCFMAWVLRQASVSAVMNGSPATAASWQDWGTDCTPPQYGAVTVLKLKNSTQHHVAFYLGEDANGWLVLGGNQGDMVSIQLFTSRDYERLTSHMPA